MEDRLIDSEERPDTNIGKPLSECPITRYNYFIGIYNNQSNQVGGVELEKMPPSKFFTRVYEMFIPAYSKV
jgi:hypothetical protein